MKTVIIALVAILSMSGCYSGIDTIRASGVTNNANDIYEAAESAFEPEISSGELNVKEGVNSVVISGKIREAYVEKPGLVASNSFRTRCSKILRSMPDPDGAKIHIRALYDREKEGSRQQAQKKASAILSAFIQEGKPFESIGYLLHHENGFTGETLDFDGEIVITP